MKRKKIPQFLVMGLCGALLIGCSNNEDTGDLSSSTIESEETQSMDTTSHESSSAASETISSSNSEEATNSSSDNQETPSYQPTGISSELIMNPDNILLPTAFPTTGSSSVTANIITNEVDNYTVSYTDDQGELAEVTGTIYENSDLASDEMDTFSNGKSISPYEEGDSDLGYGITGYGEGCCWDSIL